MSETTFNIGRVARLTGLSVHALRHYEREGILVDPVRRGPGGHRVYTEQDLEWLRLCLVLRASGMPLSAIREYTELHRQGDGTEAARLALLRQHRQHVLTQFDRLNECLDLITYKVGIYEDVLGKMDDVANRSAP